ncbi:MAG: hypothetical protein FWC11_02785 [Firmicutes bacterium]|nr:hypothetical protein [Bacillota bacterium]MCL2255765.1 hypothetical protein [Bacillota bacterium]
MKSVSEKAESVLRTLCSNYRGTSDVVAQFRCSTYYGSKKFKKEINDDLKELKKAGAISSFHISSEDIDEDNDLVYYEVKASMNISVEEMAEVGANSQTVYKASSAY